MMRVRVRGTVSIETQCKKGYVCLFACLGDKIERGNGLGVWMRRDVVMMLTERVKPVLRGYKMYRYPEKPRSVATRENESKGEIDIDDVTQCEDMRTLRQVVTYSEGSAIARHEPPTPSLPPPPFLNPIPKLPNLPLIIPCSQRTHST